MQKCVEQFSNDKREIENYNASRFRKFFVQKIKYKNQEYISGKYAGSWVGTTGLHAQYHIDNFDLIRRFYIYMNVTQI